MLIKTNMLLLYRGISRRGRAKGAITSPYWMIKLHGFPATNVFWRDLNLRQTSQQEGFFDAPDPGKELTTLPQIP